MSTAGLILEDAFPVTLTEEVKSELVRAPMTVALVADENPIGQFAWITPNAVKTLVDNHVSVFIQRGFAQGTDYTDMDYADAGAEFEDEFVRLASMARLLVKFTPFTQEQVGQMRDDQMVLSTQQPSQVSRAVIETFIRKKISALAINLILDAKGICMTDKILTETLSVQGTGIALSSFILPLMLDALLNPSLRFALQRNPTLMQCVYCYGGHLCNRDMAELLNMPWKDIVTLCWDLN